MAVYIPLWRLKRWKEAPRIDYKRSVKPVISPKTGMFTGEWRSAITGRFMRTGVAQQIRQATGTINAARGMYRQHRDIGSIDEANSVLANVIRHREAVKAGDWELEEEILAELPNWAKWY